MSRQTVKDILKQKKGMTLVETVITFIIAAILIAATAGLIISGLNLYQDTAARNLDKQIGDSVLEYTSKTIMYAKSIDQATATTQNTIGTAGAIFVGTSTSTPKQQGYLYVKEPGEGKSFTEAFTEEFYSGREIQLQLTVDKANVTKGITLTIKIMDGSDVKYERSTSVKLLNCGSEDSPKATGTWSPATVIKYMPAE